MLKLDLKKDLKYLYQPSAKKIELVTVPCFQFAMIDGEIEPGILEVGKSPAFQEAVEALYGVSYTLKFTCKLRQLDPIDYPVMALEGLWWIDGGEFDITRPGGWRWRLFILQPDPITGEMFAEALQQLKKKKGDKPALSKVRLEKFEEGLCVQTMHIGPYATEPETVSQMQAFAQENGLRMWMKHHEIYLSDPSRTAPDKMKTVLRHAVKKI